MHYHRSAIINLTHRIYVALCTAFAEMNVSFTDRLTENDRKKGSDAYEEFCGGSMGH